MLILKKLVFIIFIIFSGGCTLNNFDKVQDFNNYSIEVDTPNDKYNLYFIGNGSS